MKPAPTSQTQEITKNMQAGNNKLKEVEELTRNSADAIRGLVSDVHTMENTVNGLVSFRKINAKRLNKWRK